MHELICSCLQLPADHWPPDHYTLLGLEPGEADIRQIEHRAQERMERLRRYQLTHADQVTDGMNRLAQALVCLTDPAAKQAYDAALLARADESRRAQRRQLNYSSGLRFSDPTELDYTTPAHRFPRWLLLAWSLWLAVGVAGLVALISNFPNIKASYSAAPDGVKAGTRSHGPRVAIPSSARRRGP
jgi:hypothetical protein